MANLKQIEGDRLREQERLDSLKTASERNRWGQFATPPALALDIARYARKKLRSQSISFLDPAIGTGSFFSAVRRAFPADDIERASGIELDKGFAKAASELWQPCGLEVMPKDFTKLKPPSPENRFNAVLTNPPYVRHHHLSQSDKARLKNRVAQELNLHVSGLAGLYVYFLLLSHGWLADNGLGVWLIPSEFMDVNYGDAVKRYLTERVKLLQIHRFCPSDVQFSDALVSSAIVVFRKKKPTARHAPLFSFGGHLYEPNQKQKVPLHELRESRKWTRYPREGDKRVSKDHATFSDLFKVKRGLATGSNNFFILPRQKARELGIPAEFLRPILPSPRYLRSEIIERRRDGYAKLDDPLSLLDCNIPEADVRASFPAFWEYLKQGIEREIHRGYLTSRRRPWYSQEQRPAAPYLCTYMGRSNNGSKPFRFIWNKSDATAANVYLLLYPRAQLLEAFGADPTLYARVFNVLQTVTTDMFLGESRVYGGGLYKLEPKELARLSADAILDAIGGSVHRQLALF